MPTPDDRRAALVLLAIAALGLGVRVVTSPPEGAPGAVLYGAGAEARPEADSVAARAARLARPLGPNERIDVDAASAEELTRLPRIGPALAGRIVDDRERRGPFGSLDGLDRVMGVGPGLLETVARHATFSGAPRTEEVRSGVISLNRATAAELETLPGIGPAKARAIVEDRARNGPFIRVEDLARVPGIGPATVRRLRERVRVP
jgi:competence protein ComEA